MQTFATILIAALVADALPLQPVSVGLRPVVQLESRAPLLDIPIPLGPLGAVQISAAKPDGTVDLCANVSKQALGALTQALNTVDLGVDVNDLLGPLSPILRSIGGAVPADITVGALNQDGTATVCANVPGKKLSGQSTRRDTAANREEFRADTKRDLGVDLGGVSVDIKRDLGVDLGGVSVDI